jgi:hypothetical protein
MSARKPNPARGSTANAAADSPPFIADKGRHLASVPTPVPESWVLGPGCVEEAQLDIYLRQHAAGELPELLAPVEVWLPELPAQAPRAMQAVYDDFRLVRGLRLACCESRPVPYGAAWVAARLGIDKATVVRARDALVQLGILRFCGEMEARRKGNGTKTYLPGGDAR